MEVKPKMYYNKEPKIFNNNMLVYNTSSNINNIDVRKKIDDIIKSDSFIYSKKVNIVLDNEVITRKIIGVYNNNLMTTMNENILIDKIRDIYL